MNPSEALHSIATASQLSFSYLSWWWPEQIEQAYCVIRYGKNDAALFEKRIGVIEKVFNDPGFEEVYRFSSKSGFWVEVTSPRLRCSNSDNGKKEVEVSYDTRAI